MSRNDVSYLVAVLSNRVQAEAAYLALKAAQLPIDQMDILGKGYKSADEFGLINPDIEASKQTNQLAIWTIPFGFAAGYLFNVLTGIELIGWLGSTGNHILGGIFASVAGGMGAFVTGRLTGWTVGSGDAIAYRNRLNAGKYLVIAQGPDDFVEEATKLVRQYEPENLQGYVATAHT